MLSKESVLMSIKRVKQMFEVIFLITRFYDFVATCRDAFSINFVKFCRSFIASPRRFGLQVSEIKRKIKHKSEFSRKILQN